MTWISVKEKLPEFEVLVLVWQESRKSHYIASLTSITKHGPQWSFAVFGNMAPESNGVTHWTSLPQKPFINQPIKS